MEPTRQLERRVEQLEKQLAALSRLKSSAETSRSNFLVRTTSTITARSGTTPGSGTAQVQLLDTTLSDRYEITIRNGTEAEVPTNNYIVVVRDRHGEYWATAVDVNAIVDLEITGGFLVATRQDGTTFNVSPVGPC